MPELRSTDAVVFVIDDDAAIRDSLAALLESEGLRAETFASAEAFLARGVAGARGCVLVDVQLPEMSGLDLQRVLRSDGATLPIIVITGHADVPLAVRAMKAGAHDFIEKPFSDRVLIDSVRAALTRDRARARLDADAAEVREHVARLTPRETDVLNRMVAGLQTKQIAHELDISPRTVEIHRARVMEKMEARSLSHLVQMILAARPVEGDMERRD